MTSKDINVKEGADSWRRKTVIGRREEAHYLSARGNEAQCLRAPRAKTDEGRKPRKMGKKENETGGSGRLMSKQKSPLNVENSGG